MTVTVINTEKNEYTFNASHNTMIIKAEDLATAKKMYRKAYDLVGEKITWKII